jgi:signal transduction histidine kinase
MKNAADVRGLPTRRSRSSQRFIVGAFSLVLAGAIAATAFSFMETERLGSHARAIVGDTLKHLRILGRLASQVEKRRILVDDHILATDPVEMAGLEVQLRGIENRLRQTVEEYDPWPASPEERELWARTRRDMGRLDPAIARALELSSQNRDADARLSMQRVSGTFDDVASDFDGLIALNDQSATASLRAISMVRRNLLFTLLGIGLAAVASTALLGIWALREVRRREDETNRETEQLEARNRELDAFASRVAHDIRGPLGTLTLAMTPLAAKLPPDDRSLGIFQRGLQRMESLVADLLTLAQVESLSHGKCDPAQVVAQVQDEVSARVEASHGSMTVTVDHAQVACSEGLLRQAVTNLVDNAVKYKRPDVAPALQISGTAIDGCYEVRVSDNGMGMSEDDLAHASEPFYRSARTRDVPGTGLGLSIVNRVAEASGGRLSVQTRLGEGSTFVVRLPLAARAAGSDGDGGSAGRR